MGAYPLAAETLLQQLLSRYQDRVPDGGEGRRIGKVQLFQVLDAHAIVERRRYDVNAGLRARLAAHRAAQQTTRGGVRDQFHGERLSAEVAGAAGGRDACGNGCETLAPRLLERKAGDGYSHPENAYDGGAHDTAEALGAADRIGSGDAPHFVGGGAQRNVRRPSRD